MFYGKHTLEGVIRNCTLLIPIYYLHKALSCYLYIIKQIVNNTPQISYYNRGGVCRALHSLLDILINIIIFYQAYRNYLRFHLHHWFHQYLRRLDVYLLNKFLFPLQETYIFPIL